MNHSVNVRVLRWSQVTPAKGSFGHRKGVMTHMLKIASLMPGTEFNADRDLVGNLLDSVVSQNLGPTNKCQQWEEQDLRTKDMGYNDGKTEGL